jgi:hypothetical protein
MSSRNSPDARAAFRFNARAFSTDASSGGLSTEVERLTREQVDEACPRYPEVQSITNQSAAALNRGDYETNAAYGTAVHTRIKREINGLETTPSSPPRDEDFRAEVSSLKSKQVEARYGAPGSVRIDVLENPGTGTVCVYDIKTGDTSSLSFARMRELAEAASIHYPGTRSILVTEVRPFR